MEKPYQIQIIIQSRAFYIHLKTCLWGSVTILYSAGLFIQDHILLTVYMVHMCLVASKYSGPIHDH